MSAQPPGAVPRRYFHGGVPDLKVGDRVLPPAQTGVPSTATSGNRVCLATKPEICVVFAAFHPSGRGGVYQVEPDPPIEPDIDWEDNGESVQAPAATVVAVLDPAPLIRNVCGYDVTLADVRRAVRGVVQLGLVR